MHPSRPSPWPSVLPAPGLTSRCRPSCDPSSRLQSKKWILNVQGEGHGLPHFPYQVFSSNLMSLTVHRYLKNAQIRVRILVRDRIAIATLGFHEPAQTNSITRREAEGSIAVHSRQSPFVSCHQPTQQSSSRSDRPIRPKPFFPIEPSQARGTAHHYGEPPCRTQPP